MSTTESHSAQKMEGPSGIELNPSPPDPSRLSKRAGFLFLTVAGAVFGLIIFGIYQRGQQRYGPATSRQDTRNMTAATEAGRQVAAQVPQHPIAMGTATAADDQDLKPPLEAGEVSSGPATPPNATSRSVPPHNRQAAQQPHEPTAEERQLAELYRREIAARDAPTAVGRSSGMFGQVEASYPSTGTVADADTGALALLRTMQAASGGASVPSGTGISSALGRGLLGGAAYSASEEYQHQNMQDQKEAFLAGVHQKAADDYLPTTRTAPLNPFVIRAGWDIPAVLEQGIHSDLPGEIRALVRENVYDTASGRYLLIPQGSRLVGRYSSQIAYGQNGLQVVWERVIFPDASSIDLAGMSGQDASGRTGFRHGVDNHYARIFGFGLLTSVFGAAAQLSQNHSGTVLAYPTNGEVAASAAGQQMATLGAQAAQRNLNIQPTIKVPMGYRFNVRVNRDLAFEGPYRPLPETRSDRSR